VGQPCLNFSYFLRDIDQIADDLSSPKHLAQFKATKDEEDLPGLGQWYCTECAKWFESDNSLVTHLKGSTHKRRLVFPTSHRSLTNHPQGQGTERRSIYSKGSGGCRWVGRRQWKEASGHTRGFQQGDGGRDGYSNRPCYLRTSSRAELSHLIRVNIIMQTAQGQQQ
jgi:hypothetical protein